MWGQRIKAFNIFLKKKLRKNIDNWKRYLGIDWAIEFILEEEFEEVVEGKTVTLPHVVAPPQDFMHDRLRVGDGGAFLPLVLHQELEQLSRRHLVGSVGVTAERLPHVRWRLQLSDLELPFKAPKYSIVIVTPHSLPLSLLSFSLLITIYIYIYITTVIICVCVYIVVIYTRICSVWRVCVTRRRM